MCDTIAPLQLQLPLVALYKCYAFTFTFTFIIQRVFRDGCVYRLECQVRAYPLPAITWHVNGVELAPSPKFVQTVVGEQVVLEIREVTRADAGIYTCRARSNIGEASTSTALIVSGNQKKSQTKKPRKIPEMSRVLLTSVVAFHTIRMVAYLCLTKKRVHT